jgi:hypothetical protein
MQRETCEPETALAVRDSVITRNTNGRASSGGGIFLFYGGRGEVSDSRVADNTAESGGGGIDNDGELTLRGDDIADNTAFHGGGVRNGGALAVEGGSFTGNSAIDGGALNNLAGGTAAVAGALFAGNDQTNYGAAVANAGAMMISASIIRGNTSVYTGGIYNTGMLTIVASAIAGNSARDPFGQVGGIGGGILNLGERTVAFSTVTGNSAYGASGGDGGGIYNSGAGRLRVVASLIATNSAARDGGGVYNAGTAVIDRSAFVLNSAAQEGGGLYEAAGSQATLTDTLFLGNSPDGIGGPGAGPRATASTSGLLEGDDAAAPRAGRLDGRSVWWAEPARARCGQRRPAWASAPALTGLSGTLDGWHSTGGVLNDSGHVVGWSTNSELAPHRLRHKWAALQSLAVKSFEQLDLMSLIAASDEDQQLETTGEPSS